MEQSETLDQMVSTIQIPYLVMIEDQEIDFLEPEFNIHRVLAMVGTIIIGSIILISGFWFYLRVLINAGFTK